MSKVAIVFWSATGNTETMANCIAEGVGAAATIVPCGEMNAAKLGEYDVVAFGCPAIGAEQLEESEFEPMFASLEGSLNGKKAEQKIYYRVSGWIGGLKETKARTMMENRSDYAMELAVKGMLPKNTLGRSCMTRLHLYKGAEHPHAAQKPEAWTLD